MAVQTPPKPKKPEFAEDRVPDDELLSVIELAGRKAAAAGFLPTLGGKAKEEQDIMWKLKVSAPAISLFEMQVALQREMKAGGMLRKHTPTHTADTRAALYVRLTYTYVVLVALLLFVYHSSFLGHAAAARAHLLHPHALFLPWAGR